MAFKRFLLTELKAIGLFLSWIVVLPLTVLMVAWYAIALFCPSPLFEHQENLESLKRSADLLLTAVVLPFHKLIQGFAELIADTAISMAKPCKK